MRTSKWGEFTGIANFGMLTGDIDVVSGNKSDDNAAEEKLADWINEQLQSSSTSSFTYDSDDLIIRR